MIYTIAISHDDASATVRQLSRDLPDFQCNRHNTNEATYSFIGGYSRFGIGEVGRFYGSYQDLNKWAAAVIAANNGDTRCRTVKE
jgi:hypothetical protein